MSTQANSRVKILDEQNGKEIEQVPVFFQKKQLNGFAEWSQLRRLNTVHVPEDQRIMDKIRGLGGEAARVLLALLFINGYRNKIPMSQIGVGKMLGMARQNVGRAYKELIKHQLLAERQDEAGVKFWELSPELLWRGRGSEHLKVVK